MGIKQNGESKMQMQTQEELDQLYERLFDEWDEQHRQVIVEDPKWEEPNPIDCDYVEVMDIETDYDED